MTGVGTVTSRKAPYGVCIAILCSFAGSPVAAAAQNAAPVQQVAASGPAAAEAQDAPAASDAGKQEAQAAPPPRQWPWYQDRRFTENWQPPDWKTRNVGVRNDLDKIKAIPLNEDGSYWVSFGGQGRGRIAHQSTVTFGGPGDFKPEMWTWRARGHADVHLGSRVRVFTEGMYSFTTINGDRLGSISPNAKGDVLNAFVEVPFGLPVTKWQSGVWAGRRELQFGHERMISPGNWLLNQHTYDGAGFWANTGKGRLEAFVTTPNIVVPDLWHERDKNTTFWGVTFSGARVRRPVDQAGVPIPGGRERRIVIEPYVLGIHRNNLAFVQGRANEDRFTVGTLTYGPIGASGFDFEIEGMYQFGQFGLAWVNAQSISAEVGYRFVTKKWLPRPSLTFDYASGDKDPTDLTLGTFDPLFPLAFQFFGFHAAFERKNFVSPAAHLDLIPYKNVYFRTNFWPGFWRARLNDGVYDTFGNISRRPSPGASRLIGSQWDLGAAWLPTHNVLVYGTYLHFFAGPFWNDTQTTRVKDMNGFMILSQFTF